MAYQTLLPLLINLAKVIYAIKVSLLTLMANEISLYD
jgi:hypothetical protein